MRHAEPSLSRLPAARRQRRWLKLLVEALDRPLRRHYRVSEYSRSPRCLFRLQIGRSTETLVFSDGTRLEQGDAIAHLHFWNDHIPPIPAAGPTLAWACRFARHLSLSLQALSDRLDRQPELRDVVALHAEVALGSDAEAARIVTLLKLCGFDIVRRVTPRSLGGWLRRIGDNAFVSLVILAHNPAALRFSSLRRGRLAVFMSRRQIQRRYGTPRRVSPRRAAEWSSPNLSGRQE